MTKRHDKGRVGEPVQVYLASPDRKRLERLARQLESTKSDVLRRALEVLEHQLAEPDEHPALRIIGVAGPASSNRDVLAEARMHDDALAESEQASWRSKTKRGS